MNLRPFIRGNASDGFEVGSRCVDKGNDHVGPVAEVSWDRGWLHIVTCPHEGAVMLDIETLPMLQRALREIAKQIKREAAK